MAYDINFHSNALIFALCRVAINYIYALNFILNLYFPFQNQMSYTKALWYALLHTYVDTANRISSNAAFHAGFVLY